MTLLISLWVTSLLSLIAISFFVFSELKKSGVTLKERIGLNDFVREELLGLLRSFLSALVTNKPHAVRLGGVLLKYGKQGHTVFSERVFGRITAQRGNAGSFFLKHIAEHKETIRKDTLERVGY